MINYSWPLFPYIWNEIKFNITYESDIELVATTMQTVAEKEVGESMMEKVILFRNLLPRTPVDHLNVKERPHRDFSRQRQHLARSDRPLPRRPKRSPEKQQPLSWQRTSQKE